MTFYSFRAECLDDVIAFDTACAREKIRTSIVKHRDDAFPDVQVELETSVGLDALRDVMRGVADGHVMLQTLRKCRLKNNSLERNYELA